MAVKEHVRCLSVSRISRQRF